MRRLIFILLLMLAGTSIINAQDETGWAVTLLVTERDTEMNAPAQILTIVSDGTVTERAVPVAFQLEDHLWPDTLISPDGRYLVNIVRPLDASPSIQIADLDAGTCCTLVDAAPEVAAYTLGGFSPDGTRLSFSYVVYGTDTFATGSLATLDLASGQIDAELPVDVIGGLEDFGVWGYMGDWTTDGVQFHPNCFGCEGVFTGTYSLWDPATDAISLEAGPYFNDFFGDRLKGTGEMLLAVRDDAWPGDPQPGMFGISNVVKYAPAGIETVETVFFDPAFLSLEGAFWVADGAGAVIVNQDLRWQYLSRNAESFDLPELDGSFFLAGTPEGWLSYRNSGNTVTIQPYALGLGATGEPVTLGDVNLRVLDAPAMGSALAETLAFPEIAPPTPGEFAQLWQQAEYTCPGAMPSRLVPGQQGRVTPGTPNNVRQSPRIEGDLIGEIPGGEVFDIVFGPICEETSGIAWWQVDYNGISGWTAEGEGDTYYTEPVIP
jgi:hypothetical protein